VLWAILYNYEPVLTKVFSYFVLATMVLLSAMASMVSFSYDADRRRDHASGDYRVQRCSCSGKKTLRFQDHIRLQPQPRITFAMPSRLRSTW